MLPFGPVIVNDHRSIGPAITLPGQVVRPSRQFTSFGPYVAQDMRKHVSVKFAVKPDVFGLDDAQLFGLLSLVDDKLVARRPSRLRPVAPVEPAYAALFLIIGRIRTDHCFSPSTRALRGRC